MTLTSLWLRRSFKKQMEIAFKKIRSSHKFEYPLALPMYDTSEVTEALDSMLNFKTTMFDKVKEFETKFGKKYGGEAIMVNSGSSADLLISFALSVHSGGLLEKDVEVLIPAVTWPTHVFSVLMAGFRVQFVDVDPVTLNIDLVDLRRKINSRSRAVFVVHLLGNSSNLEELKEICDTSNLLLLEDCCEALGTSYKNKFVGTWGLASSFSFFFSHHMMTMEGGMILTRNKEFADRCRLLRAHGWDREVGKSLEGKSGFGEQFRFTTWGFNVRPTEVQAAFGLHQLDKLEKFDEARRKNFAALEEIIRPYSPHIRTMVPLKETQPNWFTFPILVTREAPFSRDELSLHLETNGVETRPIVAGNLMRQPAFNNTNFKVISESLPGADYVHDFGLYIGLHALEDPKMLKVVSNALKSFFIKIKL